MKFTIEQNTLVDPLRKLASTAPAAGSPGSSVPGADTVNAVASILIEPHETGVRFTATDNTLRLAFNIEVEGEDLKPCTVPASTLLQICSRFPADAAISFSLAEDEGAMEVKHGRSRYMLKTVDADEFPGIAAQDDECEMSMPEGILRGLLSNVRYAMAQNDMRYYLLGVLLDVDAEAVTAVATDGHRMAVGEYAAKTGVKDAVQLIIPSKAVEELIKLLRDQDDEARVHLAGNHLKLDLSGDREFHTMLVDGKYPDYRAVVPADRNLKAEVNREDLARAAERAETTADELTQAVTLTIKDGDSLEMSTRNNKGDTGEEMVDMGLTRTGDADAEAKISLNIKYLISALQAMESEKVILGVNDGVSSMLLTPSSGSSKHIIMPMKA